MKLWAISGVEVGKVDYVIAESESDAIAVLYEEVYTDATNLRAREVQDEEGCKLILNEEDGAVSMAELLRRDPRRRWLAAGGYPWD